MWDVLIRPQRLGSRATRRRQNQRDHELQPDDHNTTVTATTATTTTGDLTALDLPMVLIHILFYIVLGCAFVPLAVWAVLQLGPSGRLPGLLQTLQEVDDLYYFSLESGLLNEIQTAGIRGRLIE